MGFYDEVDIAKDKLTARTERLFMLRKKNTLDGKDTIVDGVHAVPMIIERHTNPLNKNLHDLKATYLNSTGDFMHIGNMVLVKEKDGGSYECIAATTPSSNGIYSEYKILPVNDDLSFTKDSLPIMKVTIANKGFYDETSWVNEQNVFADKDLKACLMQYNDKTKTLGLFDDLFINGQHYKIIKIDDYTFKEHNESFGTLQMAIINTPFGEIVKNDEYKTPIKGICMSDRVKDKILNSVAKALLCKCGDVKRGDYIDFTYDRNDDGILVTETYLIYNRPTKYDGYDRSLMYMCMNNMNMLTGKVVDGKAEVYSIPLYYEDNRARVDKSTNGEFIKLENSSYMIVVQHNETTDRIRSGKVKRLWINEDVYDVTGTDPFTDGLLTIGLNKGQINKDDDNEELKIANYKSQVEEIMGGVIVPTSQIIEVNNEEYLYKDYENEYLLEGAGSGVTWRVNETWCAIRTVDNRCFLSFKGLENVNKSVVLTADYNGVEFTKIIETRVFRR